jgi:hypothetical protein
MKKISLNGFMRATIFCCIFLIYSMSGKAVENPLIFPIPQQMKVTGDAFNMDEGVSIIIPEHATEKDILLANFLGRELSSKYGIALKTERASDVPQNRKVIIMGTITNQLVKKYCDNNNLNITKDNLAAEGYILQVKNNTIIIGGSDDQGAFYGLQSLRQLIDEGKGRRIRGVDVKDWPRLAFRGIRLYVPGPENIAFFKRFLRDFMALYKFNKVIIEFNCMRLDKHPEINTGWIEFARYMKYSRSTRTYGIRGEQKDSPHYDAGDGYIIEKNDVKELVDLANQNFIEVIPEIPSLTHGYYLLTKHPELAEYPGDRWPDTYCPSNPDSYKLMFDVFDEYIDVIKPKMIHIGHDEWWGAPLGVCPRCKGKDYSILYAQDITKIHDYLGSKGIKIAMWGDYLLESVRGHGPTERVSNTGVKYLTPGGLRASVVKDSVPKDILIFNWFWGDEGPEKELQELGFKQLFGNFEPNVTNWDERIKKIDLAGGAPSSWASTNEYNFGKDLLSDFLGCANLLWSSHTLEQIDLLKIVPGFIPAIRANLRAQRAPSEDGDIIEPIDISNHLNFSKDFRNFNIDFRSFKTGKAQAGFKTFNLVNSAKALRNCAIAVSAAGAGKNPFPATSGEIKINDDVSSLIFLHACALPAENQKSYFNIPDNFDTPDLLGWYEIIYEDGYKETVPVQYGVNILEWNPGGEKSLNLDAGNTGSPQKIYCYDADPIDCSASKDRPITFFAFEWTNKRFGKKIKQVDLHGSENYQSLQLDYSLGPTKPMPGNAIFLAGISKVKKREPVHPLK